MSGPVSGTVSGTVAAVGNEFEDVVQAAGASGLPVPKLRRKWVNADVDGSHVSGVAWGKGSPELVLLHGAGESARRFDAVGLVSAHPLVAIDLPGHGQSSWRRDGRYRPEQIAGAVAVAIRSFAPSARAVLGTGLGGLVAIAVAVRYPLQVRNLVLVDGLAPVDPGVRKDLPESFETKEELLALAPRLAQSTGRSELRLRSELAHDSRQREDDRWAVRYDLNAIDPPWDANDTEALWADLNKMAAPVLVIFGARSAALDISPDEVRDRVPGAEVLDRTDAAGDIFDDRAAEVLAAIEQFAPSHRVD